MTLNTEILRVSAPPREDFFGSRGGAEARREFAIWP